MSETAEQCEIRLQRIKLGAVLVARGLSRCVMDCLLDGVTAASVFVLFFAWLYKPHMASAPFFTSALQFDCTLYFSKATWLIPQLNAWVNWANKDNVKL